MQECKMCKDIITNESVDPGPSSEDNSTKCLPHLLENMDTLMSNLDDNQTRFSTLPSVASCLNDENWFEMPICENCANLIRTELNEQIEDLEHDIEKYQAFLNSADRQIKDKSYELNETESVEKLEEELARLKQEYRNVLSQVEESKANLSRLRNEETKALKDRNYLRQQLRIAQEQAFIANKDEEEKRRAVEKIEKLNVFNFVFDISFDDNGIAAVNGCRLGRLPGVNVEWNEINVALGYLALMTSSIANAIELKFEKYTVFPLGNASYIKQEGASKEREILPLYYSGRKVILWTTSFDHGLAALLNCFQQFMTKLMTFDNQFKFPYRIQANCLLDSSNSHFSIKYNGNKDELWTKAFRLLLTNFKWAFAWLAAHRKV